MWILCSYQDSLGQTFAHCPTRLKADIEVVAQLCIAEEVPLQGLMKAVEGLQKASDTSASEINLAIQKSAGGQQLLQFAESCIHRRTVERSLCEDLDKLSTALDDPMLSPDNCCANAEKFAMALSMSAPIMKKLDRCGDMILRDRATMLRDLHALPYEHVTCDMNSTCMLHAQPCRQQKLSSLDSGESVTLLAVGGCAARALQCCPLCMTQYECIVVQKHAEKFSVCV